MRGQLPRFSPAEAEAIRNEAANMEKFDRRLLAKKWKCSASTITNILVKRGYYADPDPSLPTAIKGAYGPRKNKPNYPKTHASPAVRYHRKAKPSRSNHGKDDQMQLPLNDQRTQLDKLAHDNLRLEKELDETAKEMLSATADRIREAQRNAIKADQIDKLKRELDETGKELRSANTTIKNLREDLAVAVANLYTRKEFRVCFKQESDAFALLQTLAYGQHDYTTRTIKEINNQEGETVFHVVLSRG